MDLRNVPHDQARTVRCAVLRQIIEVEHGKICQTLVKLAEPRGDVALAFFGVFVLRVFGEIAMRARDFNFFGQLVMQFVARAW